MDKIIVENIEIFAQHGVFAEEKVLGQKFILSLELDVEVQKGALSEELEKTVHYGLLSQDVIEIFKEKSIDLIETVCEKVASYILHNYDLVKGVRVLLKKPWAPIGRHLDFVAIDIFRKWNEVIIGLGTNIGDKERNLSTSIELINKDPYCRVIKVSSFKETEPWGYLEQENFLNGVIKIESIYSPEILMDKLLEIENEMGRERIIKWGPRVIDLDILFYNDLILESEKVIIPHPMIEDREFVLDGLKEICPHKLHPVLNKRVSRI